MEGLGRVQGGEVFAPGEVHEDLAHGGHPEQVRDGDGVEHAKSIAHLVSPSFLAMGTSGDPQGDLTGVMIPSFSHKSSWVFRFSFWALLRGQTLADVQPDLHSQALGEAGLDLVVGKHLGVLSQDLVNGLVLLL